MNVVHRPGLRASFALLLGLAACGDPSGAEVDAGVDAALPLEPTELLRRMSFDVRGRPPSDEEYARVGEDGEVSDALIDEMLRSDEFLDQVESWHAEVLWPNISRYRLTATPLAAVRMATQNSWEDIGTVQNNRGSDIGADPTLVDDAEQREIFVLGFENEATGITLRGGRHARPGHYCDMTPEAEYPEPSVVGSSANRYTVPAELSGDGRAYEATYYSEDPDHLGMVMPIQDWEHCQNYCFETACGDRATVGDHLDTDGDGNHDCYRDLDTPGDDPDGRHKFDVPGMRCADGYERVINTCDWAVEFRDSARGRKPARDGVRRSVYNSMRDGWRWQTHYWSRGVPIRTCAVEAQQREFGLIRNDLDGHPVRCADVRHNQGFSNEDPSCGCGPEGVYCQPSQNEHRTEDETRTEYRLRAAIEREPLRIIRSVVDRDEDYLSILSTPRSFVNGPLALAWSQQWRTLSGEGGIQATAPSAEPDPIWDSVDYEDEDWTEYERDPRHSGILTTLEFLLRFPTARSRIAQYRRVFACSSEFDYAPQPDPMDQNPDIGERRGCAGCHARLEGDGMWFGRYPDRTGLYLSESEYPIVNEECRVCALGDDRFTDPEDRHSQLYRCNADRGGSDQLAEDCSTRYASWPNFGSREAMYAGHLWPAAYRDPSLYGRIDEGPRGMVAAEMALGAGLQSCAAENAWERLVRRPATRDEISALVSQFEDAGRGYRALVRAVITSDAYRSAGQAVMP